MKSCACFRFDFLEEPGMVVEHGGMGNIIGWYMMEVQMGRVDIGFEKQREGKEK